MLTMDDLIRDPAQIQHACEAKAQENLEFREFVKWELELPDRRLNTLVETGLVELIGAVPTGKGKPARRFRANVSGLRVSYEGRHLRVNFELPGGGTREFLISLPEENPEPSP